MGEASGAREGAKLPIVYTYGQTDDMHTNDRLYIKQDLNDDIARIHCSFLDQVMHRTARVLIIGCGYGIESTQYSNSVNVDIDLDCLLFCKDQGVQNLINASADHLPFKASSFEYILLQDVIEHFPSRKYLNSVTYELFKVSSGKVIVVMPLKDYLTPIKKLYNKLLSLPLPIMAHPGHTLHLSKQEILQAFHRFAVSLDCSQTGAIFGHAIKGIGGGYAYLCMKKHI